MENMSSIITKKCRSLLSLEQMKCMLFSKIQTRTSSWQNNMVRQASQISTTKSVESPN